MRRVRPDPGTVSPELLRLAGDPVRCQLLRELARSDRQVHELTGIDLGSCRSKQLSEFAGQRFEAVITLCDRVREICPPFPGQPWCIHWSIPDPAESGRDDEATFPAFRQTAAEVDTRVTDLLAGIGVLDDGGSR